MVKPAIARPKDLREFAVVPIRAITDPRLKPRTLQVLVAFCSYADRTGRTFVSLDRIGKDIGIKAPGVAYHVKKLTALKYMVKAKPISRHIKSATRRIVYRHSISEDTIRSRLSPEHQMELAETERTFKYHAKANSEADPREKMLREKFRVSCEQFFRDALADGWYIGAMDLRTAPIRLAEQAMGCLVRDRDAPQSHGEAPYSPVSGFEVVGPRTE